MVRNMQLKVTCKTGMTVDGTRRWVQQMLGPNFTVEVISEGEVNT